MYDQTQLKIIQATMNLIMIKGYSSTTTKDIAKKAGVNECTIFRKFNGKKEIVLSAMALPEWNPRLKKEDFTYSGNIESDLISFSKIYLNKVTPRMVKVSIGLRTPELYDDTAEKIMEIPDVFMNVLRAYFSEMLLQEKIKCKDIEGMALQVLSMNFGFVFLKASFGDELSDLAQDEYIVNSINRFVYGI